MKMPLYIKKEERNCCAVSKWCWGIKPSDFCFCLLKSWFQMGLSFACQRVKYDMTLTFYNQDILQSRYLLFMLKRLLGVYFVLAICLIFFFLKNAAFQMKTFTFFHLGVEPLSQMGCCDLVDAKRLMCSVVSLGT